MKKLRLFVILSIMVCIFWGFTACSGPALSKPFGVKVDEAVRTLTWNPVRGATGYRIKITSEYTDEIEVEIKRNNYDISQLETGCNFEKPLDYIDYTIGVQAIGDKVNFGDSPWTEITVRKAYENGATYSLINGGAEYELTGIGTASGDLVIPSYYRGKTVTSIGTNAFYNNSRLKSITLPDTITNIGSKAFYNCVNLEEINIPNSVTYIGNSAFHKCSKLTEIEIPGSVKNILENTFMRCGALSKITIGEGVLTVEKNAFLKCIALEEVTLPNSVVDIGEMAFADCSLLKEVSLGKNLLQLGNSAFLNCQALQKVDFGEESSLMHIGSEAFRYDYALESIELPDSVVELSASAFGDCEKLKNVKIGAGMTKIYPSCFYGTALWEESNNADGLVYAGDYKDGNKWIVGIKSHDATTINIQEGTVGICVQAFYVYSEIDKDTGKPIDPNALQVVTFPDSLKYINDYAFFDCINMNYITIGKGVVSIGIYAFYGCELLDSVTFHEGSVLETIGQGAFQGCKNLGNSGSGGLSYPRDIRFPSTLKKIGKDAFRDTYFYEYYQTVVYVGGWVVGTQNKDDILALSIKEYTGDPADRTDDEFDPDKDIYTVGIADSAFNGCVSLSSVRFPSKLVYIGRSAFYKCAGLTSISIPQGVTTIEDYTFYECKLLKTVNIPETVTYIGRSAFYKSYSLKSITIPDSVTYIGEYAFYESEIETLELGNKLEKIDARAFYNCQRLLSVEIPASVSVIGDHAFSKCYSMKSLAIKGDGAEKQSDRIIGRYAFYTCVYLTDVVIDGSVAEIGEYAFKNCIRIKSLTLGEGIERIGKSAFVSCLSCKNVVLPSTLKSLGNQVFRGCEELSSVLLRGNIESMGRHIFYACPKLTIYTEVDSIPEGWHQRWNSAYRSVIFGLKIAVDDNGIAYVESFTKDKNSFVNLLDGNIISGPGRNGYTFKGWAKTQNGAVAIAADEVMNVADGTTLYAVWEEGEEEVPQESGDQNQDANQGQQA